MRRSRRAIGLAGVLTAVSLLTGCGDDPPSGPTGGPGPAERFEPGDELEGPDRPTWPLTAGTLQAAGDDAIVMTCGGLACRWDERGGRARGIGVGGDALRVSSGVGLVPAQDQVLVADVAGGEVTATFDGHEGTPSRDSLPVIASVALSPDSEVAVSVGKDGRAWLWRTDDGSEVRELDLPDDAYPSAPVFSPDGDRMALTYSVGTGEEAVRAATALDTATGEVLGVPDDLARVHAWAPDGSYLVGTDDEGGLATWDADDWTRGVDPGLTSAGPAAVGPDSGTVAFVDGEEDTTIRLWDLADDAVQTVRTDHPDRVVDLAWSADGGSLASASTEAAEPGFTPEDPRDEVQVRPVEGGGPVVRLGLPTD